VRNVTQMLVIQELRAYGNAARLGPRKLMNGHQEECSEGAAVRCPRTFDGREEIGPE
jgi:hypothetical protein